MVEMTTWDMLKWHGEKDCFNCTWRTAESTPDVVAHCNGCVQTADKYIDKYWEWNGLLQTFDEWQDEEDNKAKGE